MQIEQRTVRLDAAEVKGRAFIGHAAVFGVRADIGDPIGGYGFVEQVAKGAFSDSIRGGNVVMLADHDPAKPLARQSAGTLRLSEDRVGLATSADLVKTVYGNDLLENVRVGNVAGMSFGFAVPPGGDTWSTETRQGPTGTVSVDVRTLVRVDLYEVSTTAFPAYPTTDASVRAVRSARGHQSTHRSGPRAAAPSWHPLDLDMRMIRARYGLPIPAEDCRPLDLDLRLIALRHGLPMPGWRP